ncbi:hypothetical protein BVRB_019000, partial [Beta vulgaris subsp. vulgaris]
MSGEEHTLLLQKRNEDRNKTKGPRDQEHNHMVQHVIRIRIGNAGLGYVPQDRGFLGLEGCRVNRDSSPPIEILAEVDGAPNGQCGPGCPASRARIQQSIKEQLEQLAVSKVGPEQRRRCGRTVLLTCNARGFAWQFQYFDIAVLNYDTSEAKAYYRNDL